MSDVFKLAGSISIDTAKGEAALTKFKDAGEKATKAISNGADKLGNVVGSVGDKMKVLDAKGPLGLTQEAFDRAKEVADRFGVKVEDVAKRVVDQEMRNALKGAVDEFNDFGDSADDAAEGVDDLGDEADDAAKKVDDLGDEAESSSDRMGSAFKKLGGIIVAAFAVDKIKDFGMSMVEAAAESNAIAAQFDQIFGGMASEGRKAIDDLAKEFGMVDTRITPSFTKMTSKFKGLGLDTETAMNKATQATKITADAAAFLDIAFEDAQSALNSFVNGSYEGGEAIGLFANETQLAAYAVESGLIGVKSEWQALDEATKQAARLDFATKMQEAAGATGQAARESGEYANQLGNFKAGWEKFLAALGNMGALDLALVALQKMSGAVDWMTNTVLPGFQRAGENAKKLWHDWEGPLKAAGAAIGVLAGAFAALAISQAAATSGSVAKAITGIVTSTRLWAAAQWALNTAMSANPIGIVITAIAALTAAVVVLWNENDDFREAVISGWGNVVEFFKGVGHWFSEDFVGFFRDSWDAISEWGTGVKEGVTGFFTSVVDIAKDFGRGFYEAVTGTVSQVGEWLSTAWSWLGDTARTAWDNVYKFITDPIKKAANFVSDIIDDIKGFFNFDIKWPKIPLPHFDIKPAGWSVGDLLKGKIPRLGIDWYAKGGVLTEPTIFGALDGRLQAGGEAGPEAVAPIDVLQDYVRSAVREERATSDALLARMLDILERYLPEIGGDVVLDSGALVGALSPRVDNALGRESEVQRRGAPKGAGSGLGW